MKYVFRFFLVVVFLFFAGIGLILLARAPGKPDGYVVLLACVYLGWGFHKLISVHYRANSYDDSGKAFWLGWVLLIFPVFVFWKVFEIFLTHEYTASVGRYRTGYIFTRLTNWLGDTFGYGVPAVIYLVIGTAVLIGCIQLMKAR